LLADLKTEDEQLVDTVSDALYERIGDDSIFSLPPVSRVVTIVLALQGVTNNGGFIYFFEADWPGKPPYSVFADAFRAIGADETAECIEVAASVFPFTEPHLHGDAWRNYLRDHCMIDGRTNDSATLVKLGDRVIDNSDTDYGLLAEYIRKHLDEIRNA
jgi:Domain of unknown function (DUF4375)